MIPPELASHRLAVRENVPLAGRTTLRIGGPARFLADVEDAGALAAVLGWARSSRLPVLLLGRGSNLLVPDEGFPGVAVVLAGDFRSVTVRGTEIVAGGGTSLASLAGVAKRAGLTGLEGLSGIPSSVGGAVRINAGSYGSEIFDLLVSVGLVSRAGERRDVAASEIPHGYRWTALIELDDVVASATLRLRAAAPEAIRARMAEVAAKRREALPPQPNAGSIFRNPLGDFAGRLLEACGLKGRRIGGAEVSTVHANVVVNRGGATAGDVRALMAEMQRAVRDRFGVELVPEIEVLPPASVE
jgi:UDP-N-acetylmuramate dehydrogenase